MAHDLAHEVMTATGGLAAVFARSPYTGKEVMVSVVRTLIASWQRFVHIFGSQRRRAFVATER